MKYFGQAAASDLPHSVHIPSSVKKLSQKMEYAPWKLPTSCGFFFDVDVQMFSLAEDISSPRYDGANAEHMRENIFRLSETNVRA